MIEETNVEEISADVAGHNHRQRITNPGPGLSCRWSTDVNLLCDDASGERRSLQ